MNKVIPGGGRQVAGRWQAAHGRATGSRVYDSWEEFRPQNRRWLGFPASSRRERREGGSGGAEPPQHLAGSGAQPPKNFWGLGSSFLLSFSSPPLLFSFFFPLFPLPSSRKSNAGAVVTDYQTQKNHKNVYHIAYFLHPFWDSRVPDPGQWQVTSHGAAQAAIFSSSLLSRCFILFFSQLAKPPKPHLAGKK